MVLEDGVNKLTDSDSRTHTDGKKINCRARVCESVCVPARCWVFADVSGFLKIVRMRECIRVCTCVNCLGLRIQFLLAETREQAAYHHSPHPDGRATACSSRRRRKVLAAIRTARQPPEIMMAKVDVAVAASGHKTTVITAATCGMF